MVREDWWPTPIWTDQLNFDTKKVAERCLRLRAAGFSNRNFTNVGGWQSCDVNLNDYEEFHIIRDVLNQKISELSSAISNTFKAELLNIWININDRGCRNEKHVHPRSTLSGTIYIQTDDSTGNIVFFNDDSPSKHYTFEPGETSALFYKHVAYKPKDGMIIFFPSWVPHMVRASNSNLPRISMSFNIQQTFEGL
jgi:uncharacterized protein (TIGR02466 family)